MIAPLALTHRKRTWVGVIPRRLAAFSTAKSTGPPGEVLIDLKKNLSISISIIKQVKYELKTSKSRSDDAVFRMIFQKRCIFGIIIWVQSNLSWESSNWVQIIMVSNEEGYLINSWLDMCNLK